MHSPPYRVTITGADDSVSVRDLATFAAEFPFVEWGILFSGSHQGAPRYPSPKWLNELKSLLMDVPLQISAHLCGRYVRNELAGKQEWEHTFPVLSGFFDRVQLNFHGLPHSAFEGFWPSPHYIYQCDGVNDSWIREMKYGAPLFDTSGGAGVLPGSWPEAWPNRYCGYAGGLGPDNVLEELEKIEQAARGQTFWIDMERRVRTDDDRALDLAKVRSVLEQCSSLARV